MFSTSQYGCIERPVYASPSAKRRERARKTACRIAQVAVPGSITEYIKLDALGCMLAQVLMRLESLHSKLDARGDHCDRSESGCDERLDSLDSKLDAIGEHCDRSETLCAIRLDSLDCKLDATGEHLDRSETLCANRLDSLDSKLDAMGGQLDRSETLCAMRFDSLDSKLDAMFKHFDRSETLCATLPSPSAVVNVSKTILSACDRRFSKIEKVVQEQEDHIEAMEAAHMPEAKYLAGTAEYDPWDDIDLAAQLHFPLAIDASVFDAPGVEKCASCGTALYDCEVTICEDCAHNEDADSDVPIPFDIPAICVSCGTVLYDSEVTICGNCEQNWESDSD